MRPFALSRYLVCASMLVAVAACYRSATPPTGETAPAPGGGAAARNAPPVAVTPANVALGDSLFNNGNCQRCHGRSGVGATNAPPLNDNQWLQLKTGSFEEIVGIITTGVPVTAIKDTTRKRAMAPRGGPANLTDAQIQAVAAYVYTLSHK